ncbi:MAG: very short patch repair endonuclease [Candidatus Gracilibacteria bacterium]|nr:very short patch repair endonuclease [Candidatus Gracilibacteria bacterium]
MSGIRSRNTGPEIIVRKWLHAKGYRFRLYRKDLPGCPDIILPKKKIAIFVNGCFFHQHGCSISYVPKTRTEWWQAKFKKNKERDAIAVATLEKNGWTVLTIWECQIRNELYKNILEDCFKERRV